MLYSSSTLRGVLLVMALVFSVKGKAKEGNFSWPSVKQQQEVVDLLGGKGSFKNTKPPQKQASPIMIFISTSMPHPMLVQILEEAKKYRASVILKGFIEGSYKRTVLFLKPLIEKAKIGVEVSPALFKQYNIKRAPTIVVKCPKGKDILPGATSLNYAIKRVEASGDCAQFMKNFLKKNSKKSGA